MKEKTWIKVILESLWDLLDQIMAWIIRIATTWKFIYYIIAYALLKTKLRSPVLAALVVVLGIIVLK